MTSQGPKFVAFICFLVFCFVIFTSLYFHGIPITPHRARVPRTDKKIVPVFIASSSASPITKTKVTTPTGYREPSKPLEPKQQEKEVQVKNSQLATTKVPLVVTNHSVHITDKSALARPSRKKYLIYLCDKRRSCGGWGDRQRGMMAAYVLALVTGRTFGINMSYPCDIKLFYVPNQVNWYIKISDIRNLTWEVLDWMDNRNSIVDCESDFNVKYPSDVVFLRTNQDVIKRISNSPRYGKFVPKEYKTPQTAFGNAWRKTMKLSIHMEENLELFMSKVPQAGKLVCGHIRMRRSKTIPNDGAAITTLKNLEAMWNLLARYEKNASRIFIASDSMEARNIARKRFRDKEIDSDGLVVHIDRQGRANNACKGFETALVEQAVLAQCAVLILSPSGFSRRAAMMSSIKQELFSYSNGTIRKGT